MKEIVEKMQLKKYSSYKDSGVEWLGEIPSHWKTLSNKYIFSLKKNQVGKKSSEYVLLSLTLNGVIKRDMENPQGKFPAEFDTYQEVKKGDFIFCLFDVEETPRTIGLSDYDGMITGAYTVMQPNQNFDKPFLYYFYLNLDTDKRMKPLYTGLRNTISKENFFSFKTFVPPIEEQTRIANFLDQKTTLIDQAIAQKEKQISLLKEHRQILKNKVLTSEINAKRNEIESGIELLGKIPKNWKVIELKLLAKKHKYSFVDGPFGSDLKNEEYTSSGIPLIQLNNIKVGFHSLEKLNYISPEKSLQLFKHRAYKNDIVIAKMADPVARATRVSMDYEIYNIVADCIKLSVDINQVDIDYLVLAINADYVRLQAEKKASGTTRLRISLDTAKRLKIAIPPLEEQKEIKELIKIYASKIDNAISLKEKEIEKLKEYKSTLINSAVTGKIKVF